MIVDVALEQCMKAVYKMTDAFHVFLIPRLYFPLWLRMLYKLSYLVFKLLPGSWHWPKSMQEPLFVGILFPLLSRNPLTLRRMPLLVGMERNLRQVLSTGEANGGDFWLVVVCYICCRCHPWHTCHRLCPQQGLIIAVALSVVALFGILVVVVVVVKGLIIVVTLGLLIIVVALSKLVIIVAPGILVLVFAFGALVIVIALSVLLFDIIGEGLIIVVASNGHVVVIVALGERLVVAIVANGVLVVVVGNVALLGILLWIKFWCA